MGRYPKHEKVVTLAGAELAAGVRENPPGSNTGRRIREYQSATWLGGTGWPWCVAFWQWLLEEAGFMMPYRGAGAYALLEWARKQGWAVSSTVAVPGDAVVFNIGAGHLGVLVEPVGPRSKTVRTIDGNVLSRVDSRTRPLATVRGFVHFPEHAIPTPAKPPMFEVVTGADGRKVVYVSGANAVGRKLPELLRRYAHLTIRRRAG